MTRSLFTLASISGPPPGETMGRLLGACCRGDALLVRGRASGDPREIRARRRGGGQVKLHWLSGTADGRRAFAHGALPQRDLGSVGPLERLANEGFRAVRSTARILVIRPPRPAAHAPTSSRYNAGARLAAPSWSPRRSERTVSLAALTGHPESSRDSSRGTGRLASTRARCARSRCDADRWGDRTPCAAAQATALHVWVKDSPPRSAPGRATPCIWTPSGVRSAPPSSRARSRRSAAESPEQRAACSSSGAIERR